MLTNQLVILEVITQHIAFASLPRLEKFLFVRKRACFKSELLSLSISAANFFLLNSFKQKRQRFQLFDLFYLDGPISKPGDSLTFRRPGIFLQIPDTITRTSRLLGLRNFCYLPLQDCCFTTIHACSSAKCADRSTTITARTTISRTHEFSGNPPATRTNHVTESTYPLIVIG